MSCVAGERAAGAVVIISLSLCALAPKAVPVRGAPRVPFPPSGKGQ